MRTLAVLVCAVALAGCDFLTDAATRVAYDIEAATLVMRAKKLDRYEFTHRPKESPDGVTGEFELTIHESGEDAYQGVIDIGRYHTSYHNRFVIVPRTLSIKKQAGESCVLVLERRNDRIELTELR